MVKLLVALDPIAIEIRGLISEGRNKEAEDRVLGLLRAGKASAQVQVIAADMMRPSRKRGRPKAKFPAHWIEIGQAVDIMRSAGMTFESAILAASEQFNKDPDTIRRAEKVYRQGKAEG